MIDVCKIWSVGSGPSWTCLRSATSRSGFWRGLHGMENRFWPISGRSQSGRRFVRLEIQICKNGKVDSGRKQICRRFERSGKSVQAKSAESAKSFLADVGPVVKPVLAYVGPVIKSVLAYVGPVVKSVLTDVGPVGKVGSRRCRTGRKVGSGRCRTGRRTGRQSRFWPMSDLSAKSVLADVGPEEFERFKLRREILIRCGRREEIL